MNMKTLTTTACALALGLAWGVAPGIAQDTTKEQAEHKADRIEREAERKADRIEDQAQDKASQTRARGDAEADRVRGKTSGGWYWPVGGQNVYRMEVATGTVTLFATVPEGPGPNPGLKGLFPLPDGTVLVCNGGEVVRLATNGSVLQTYTPAETSLAQSLADVEPTTDGTAFWCWDEANSAFWKFNITTGAQLDHFEAYLGSGSSTSIVVYRMSTDGVVGELPPELTVDAEVDVDGEVAAEGTLPCGEDEATLIGSYETDSEETPTVAWTQESGPDDATIADPAALETLVSAFPTHGVYVFRFTVTLPVEGGDPVVAYAEVTLTVEPCPPELSAGSDRTICVETAPHVIDLEGTISGDDGDNREWTQISGPTATITTPTSPTTAVTLAGEGVYVFQWAATNGAAEASDTVTITVIECPCVGYPLPLIHQWFDQIAEPAHDYRFYTYAHGTTVPLATYFNERRTIKNPNPMVFDAAARNTIFIEGGVRYDLVMKDGAGTVIWERDDYSWPDTETPPAIAPEHVQPGTIVMHTSHTLPAGWLRCDGATVSRATYRNLFNIIGTTFGTGNGATTFKLPDLRQRFPFGVATSGTGDALGDRAGAIDHVHTGPEHSHPIATHTHGLAHTHPVPRDGWFGVVNTPPVAGRLQAGGSGVGAEGSATQAVTNTTSGDSTAAVTGTTALTTGESGTANTAAANPALLALNFLIKT